MRRVTTDLRAALAHPGIYELWSHAVGGVRCRDRLVNEHVRPVEATRVLDLGCGTGEILTFLPSGVRYVGVDMNPGYIASAHERFASRQAEFHVGDVTALGAGLSGFDCVLAFGVVHHLDDAGAESLFRSAASALVPTGRLVTVDGVFTEPQGRVARTIIGYDRGQFVRNPDAYATLARTAFSTVEPTIRHDLLRIPYTHCVLECEAPLV